MIPAALETTPTPSVAIKVAGHKTDFPRATALASFSRSSAAVSRAGNSSESDAESRPFAESACWRAATAATPRSGMPARKFCSSAPKPLAGGQGRAAAGKSEELRSKR